MEEAFLLSTATTEQPAKQSDIRKNNDKKLIKNFFIKYFYKDTF